MPTQLENAMRIATAGMRVQGERLRLVAENLANADSTARAPGGEPYRRQTVSFSNELDRSLGVRLVQVDRYGVDRGELPREYDPDHPAAGPDGYVKLPNVEPFIEMADMREAQRSYEANLNALDVAKRLLERTIDLLR